MYMAIADIIVVFCVGNMQEEVEGVLKLQYWMNYASKAYICLSVRLSTGRSMLSVCGDVTGKNAGIAMLCLRGRFCIDYCEICYVVGNLSLIHI